MPIARIACPSCGASEFRHEADGSLICRYCGARYRPPQIEIACPVCSTLNPAQAKRCMTCGTTLDRLCPACAHLNPPEADLCESCGEPLDVLTSLAARARETGEERVPIRTERMASIKREDQQYMAEQRAQLDAEEHERLARLAEQRDRARKEQRRIALFVVIGLLVLSAAIIGLLLLLIANAA
jgi:hypothetical protein